jgi:hypothetical protein
MQLLPVVLSCFRAPPRYRPRPMWQVRSTKGSRAPHHDPSSGRGGGGVRCSLIAPGRFINHRVDGSRFGRVWSWEDGVGASPRPGGCHFGLRTDLPRPLPSRESMCRARCRPGWRPRRPLGGHRPGWGSSSNVGAGTGAESAPTRVFRSSTAFLGFWPFPISRPAACGSSRTLV